MAYWPSPVLRTPCCLGLNPSSTQLCELVISSTSQEEGFGPVTFSDQRLTSGSQVSMKHWKREAQLGVLAINLKKLRGPREPVSCTKNISEKSGRDPM